ALPPPARPTGATAARIPRHGGAASAPSAAIGAEAAGPGATAACGPAATARHSAAAAASAPGSAAKPTRLGAGERRLHRSTGLAGVGVPTTATAGGAQL